MSRGWIEIDGRSGALAQRLGESDRSCGPPMGPHRHSGRRLEKKTEVLGALCADQRRRRALCLASPLASALGLGRLSVQSALGEALRAEIEVTSLTPEEQASLRIRVAPPEAYRAANVDYNPVLPSTRATLEKRADGRLFVRLVSDRGVQEPFVDVILEISWATGRLVREYTLLFDPPATHRAPARRRRAGTATSPVISAAPPAPAPLPPIVGRAVGARARAKPPRAERAAPRRRAQPPPSASRDEAAAAHARRRPRPASARATARRRDEYRVRAGDTLSKIAGAHAAPGVSLDQMLVVAVPRQPERLHRQQHEPPEGRRRAVGAFGRRRAGACRRPRRARPSPRRAPTSAPIASASPASTHGTRRSPSRTRARRRQGPGLGRRQEAAGQRHARQAHAEQGRPRRRRRRAAPKTASPRSAQRQADGRARRRAERRTSTI